MKIVNVALAALTIAFIGAVSAGHSAKSFASETLRPKMLWLAAGDSFSAGRGVADSSGTCGRSHHAYAQTVRDQLGSTAQDWNLLFTACSGDVADGIEWQIEEAAARAAGIDALTSRCRSDLDDTRGPDSAFLWSIKRTDAALRDWRKKCAAPPVRFDRITLSFGGNDLGFAKILEQCLGVTADTWYDFVDLSCPSESEISNRINALSVGGIHYRGKTISYGDYLKQIVADDLTPNGTLYVLGYPHLLDFSSQWPVWQSRCAGLAYFQADMLHRQLDNLDRMLSTAVTNDLPSPDTPIRVEYVPVKDEFQGHELCGHRTEWINGITRRTDDSFHPNRAGEDAYADLLLARLPKDSSESGPTASTSSTEPPSPATVSPAQEPRVTVTRSTGLSDVETVDVHASGLSPGAAYWAIECAGPFSDGLVQDGSRCSVASSGGGSYAPFTADAAGEGGGKVELVRILNPVSGSTRAFDCGEVECAVVIIATGADTQAEWRAVVHQAVTFVARSDPGLASTAGVWHWGVRGSFDVTMTIRADGTGDVLKRTATGVVQYDLPVTATATNGLVQVTTNDHSSDWGTLYVQPPGNDRDHILVTSSVPIVFRLDNSYCRVPLQDPRCVVG